MNWFISILVATFTGIICFPVSACSQTPVGMMTASESKFIDSLIAMMTPEEKAGQLTLFASGWEATGPALDKEVEQLIREGKVGAILNAYTAGYVRKLQELAVESTRLKIPLLIGYDVTRDPRWGRVAERAGEDTWLASKIAAARVRGFQGSDLRDPSTMMACAKHFAAYGAPQAGRDYGMADLSQLTLYETYLPPYQACINAGAGSVMTSFNEIAGIPSTANSWLINDLLRIEWGFQGFVVSDWTSIKELIPHGIASNTEEAALQAFLAGVDLDMESKAYLDHLPDLLDDSSISQIQLNLSVRRILEAKMKLGLFEDPYRYCNRSITRPESLANGYRSVARNMAASSCVLLKNPKQILPISGKVSAIAIIGPLGDSKADMLGNWSAAGSPEECITLLEGIRNHAGDQIKILFHPGCDPVDTTRIDFREAVDVARQADFVILALGEPRWMSGEASSRTTIGLPGHQNRLAEAIVGAGKPTAVVLFNGRPLAISRLDRLPVAILEGWFGGTEAGNGLADILFGKTNPSGKLTMSFPRNEGQIPLYYNAKNTGRPFDPSKPDEKFVSRYLDCFNEPLYPFGYGLSYTRFSYSNLQVTGEESHLVVTVTVTNEGLIDGTEIVQLYLRDLTGVVTRPMKELKGFQKVTIPSGTSREITFHLNDHDLRYVHPYLTRSWEPGAFIIHVGTSSESTLSQQVSIPK